MATEAMPELMSKAAHRYQALHGVAPPGDFLRGFSFYAPHEPPDPAKLSFRRLRGLGAPRVAGHPCIRQGLIPKGGMVLDAGCGAGDDSRWLQRNGYGTVTGIDRDPNVMELGRAFYMDAGQPSPSFVVGDCTDMDFGDGCFHLVYSGSILHTMHSTDEAHRYLKECRRVLAAGYPFFGSSLGSESPVEGFTRLQLTKAELRDMLEDHFGLAAKLEYRKAQGPAPAFRAYFLMVPRG